MKYIRKLKNQEIYTKNTISIKRKIDGVFIPESKEDIVELLSYANAEGKKVWPISTGKNWGYGSSTPVTDGNIILDLCKLNAISDFDETNGIITLGPGWSYCFCTWESFRAWLWTCSHPGSF